MENIVSNIRYLDFVNKINEIANKLLYCPNEGYFYKKGKDAIDEKEKVCEKFLFEINKTKSLGKISIDNEFITKKKKQFLSKVNKHYASQIYIWADDVFDEFISNHLFELSLDKTKIGEIKAQLENLINWYCEFKKLNATQIDNLKQEYNKKIANVLKNDDVDYIPNSAVNKTKPDVFLNIWNILLKNYEKFFEINLDEIKFDLSNDDYNYFLNLQNKLTTYKKEILLDEILLIDTACCQIPVENDDKFQLIKSIMNDFMAFSEKNKGINEDDKISLVKRRIALYKDKLTNKTQYYTKLIDLNCR